MRRPLPAALLVLAGLGLLHASLLTDLCLRYVKEGMRPALVASGAVLLALGAAEAWSYRRRPTKEAAGAGQEGGAVGEAAGEGEDAGSALDGHGHDHTAVPRVAWLLFLPVLSLLVQPPPALGAYTAARQAPREVTAPERFAPLPDTSPLPLTLTDFTRRVRQDRTRAVEGRSVRLTGFVTPGRPGAPWDLTRLILNCCAADAQSVKVRVHGTPAPPADTWVTVTGAWHPGGRLGTASAPVALDARTVREIPRPANGYKDALPPAGTP